MSFRRAALVVLGFFASLSAGVPSLYAQQQKPSAGSAAVRDTGMPCEAFVEPGGEVRRTVCADVAALDHILVYNRFGSFNPFGMIFALRRDLSSSDIDGNALDADDCDALSGAEEGVGPLAHGAVRLKDCRRPRPLVLRANVGDVLHIKMTNLLADPSPDFSSDFCHGNLANSALKRAVRAEVSKGSENERKVGEVSCDQSSGSGEASADWPHTRSLSVAIQGLVLIPSRDKESNEKCLGLRSFDPGEAIDCRFEIDREGTYFLSSNAAPSGGEGNGGSITHGLFGAVVVEQIGTSWFRSQVSKAALDVAWKRCVDQWQPPQPNMPLPEHARLCPLDYNASVDGTPVLNMVRQVGPNALQLVHSDLNAVIHRSAGPDPSDPAEELPAVGFREFSVFFHDELKTFYTRNFEELGKFDQLAGVRDGFAINYGSSGMGTLLLANRKGIGPANDCPECLYEEFFLQSWANGDPALLEQFGADPSNVHHSYLNDRVVFRNFHAGPKETHVFHLHAHQWFSGNDSNRGAYLDSQTVAPQQGFTYNIYGGGLNANPPLVGSEPGDKGSFASQGSGNRNRTIGDSIFHCHLYPHFAQGMWELWRVHDTLEDGTRKLPDGQKTSGLSTTERVLPEAAQRRGGSFDQATGKFIPGGKEVGTPIPAIVPIPDLAIPPIPSYADTMVSEAMPGYPFYIAGKPGHRAPQAPLDIAEEGSGNFLDGGLPRHVVKDGGEREFEVKGEVVGDVGTEERRASQQQLIAKTLALGDFTGHLKSADLDLLPYDGTDTERAAMAFHHDGAGVTVLNVKGEEVLFDATKGGYPTIDSPMPGGASSASSIFHVNGSPAKPGAPFADPCGVARATNGTQTTDPLFMPGQAYFRDPALTGFRRYRASAVQLNLVTNRAGWHDPQARINVLSNESDGFKDSASGDDLSISPTVRGDVDPFFFRALSGECIEFRHTNELPKDLELDDFQVRTPTDTIGQHIHLVKFDVTSSDGSGNGWNYEDGTLAPDEIASRICAFEEYLKANDPASIPSRILANRPTQNPRDPKIRLPANFCESLITTSSTWWRQKLSENRDHFQTTVQRWFADPILSPRASPLPGEGNMAPVDRTLRTVFTHDHFGPSSIQQHGFYAALLIEPKSAKVCGAEGSALDCTAERTTDALIEDNATSEKMVGARKIVDTDPSKDPTHPDYREYALAIADFATLYDPRDFESESAYLRRTERAVNGSPEGLATLVCEGRYAKTPADLIKYCGSALSRDETVAGRPYAFLESTPPAWVAAGKPGSLNRGFALTSMFKTGEIEHLREHTIDYRKRAAGNPAGDRLAKPVSAPQRPESISVDHHDPYLVNYRGEPLPLRIGTKNENQKFSADCKLLPIDSYVEMLSSAQKAATIKQCSISRQIAIRPGASPAAGPSGDMADVFLSAFHKDPVTPILEAYDGERIVTRLIQGAQEVQHTFNVEGYTFQRHIDQAFPSGVARHQTSAALRPGAEATLNVNCETATAAPQGRPTEYAQWRKSGSASFPVVAQRQFWERYEALVSTCDNMEGLTSAQEVGISEHFEFAGQMRQAHPGAEAARRDAAAQTTDYFYSFGSVDAIWNGAWGLTRIFRNESARDNSACDPLDGDCSEDVGNRLLKLPPASVTESLKRDVGSSQILSCRQGAPKVHAIVAALEVSRVWPNGLTANNGDTGTSYGGGLYDRNGLMFALIDAKRLFNDPATALAPTGAAAWNNIKLDRITEIVRQTYDRPEPLTLRVNANDCVTLHIMNGLAPHRSTGGLKDDRGDAQMPRITPLNVDPNWEKIDVTANAEENSPQHFRADDSADVRPSARLGISIPLPSLDYAQSLPLPFGQNLTSTLAPAECATNSAGYAVNCRMSINKPAITDVYGFVRRADSIERQTFYAGRIAVKGNFESIVAPAVDVFLEKMEQRSGGPQFTFEPLDGGAAALSACNGGVDADLLGQPLALCPSNPSGMQVAGNIALADWNAAVAEVMSTDTFVNWTPYAFGALPIGSTGDKIGHGVHGLFGSIVVEPEGASSPERVKLANSDIIALKPRDGGKLWAATVTTKDLEDRDHTVREFVLAYQDGLNLRDVHTRNRWFSSDGTARLVADCAVCDDSYDLGDQGVNYRSDPFFQRLRGSEAMGQNSPEAQYNFNAYVFAKNFFLPAHRPPNMPVLKAEVGDEVVVRVIHPGGRARQRSFVTIGNDYDDLFPSFGFPHSALLAPGKGVRAALTRKVNAGCYLWHDGTVAFNSGGTWGLLDVVPEGKIDDLAATSC